MKVIRGIVLLLPLAGCGAAEGDANAPRAAAVPKPGAGHQRMLDLLAQIERDSREANPFLGESMLGRLKADLAQLGSAAEPERRWLIHVNMGMHELRLGRVQAGIEHYLEAWRMMEAATAPVPRPYYLRTAFETGVAFLRLGETQNCVAHGTSESCILPIRDGGVHRNKEGSEQALRYFEDVLAKAEAGSDLALRARWLLNIAHMTLGSYPQGVPAQHLIPQAAFESDEPFPRFPDVAARLKLNTFDLAGGAIAEDFDGDGFLDLLVSSSNTSGQLRYFRNSGDGSFSERTAEAGLVGELGGLNLTHADYDNDGHPDVLVLRGGWFREVGMHPDSLLRNNGDGTFTDVTFDAGLGGVAFPNQVGAFADYDNDGDLDIYLGAETDLKRNPATDYAASSFDTQYNVRAPCSLFRNNGDGTFTDVAAAAGVENLRYTKGVTWGDYDGDRFPDLYVSNLGDRNRLYHNDRDGTFSDVAREKGMEGPIASFATWFWDVNNDGALDLHVNAYGGPTMPADVASVARNYLGLPRQGTELAHLYLGDGKGAFREAAAEWNLTDTTLPMGSNYGDLDNDGWLDFYLATGYPYYEGLVPNVMYRNREGRGFADLTTAGGFGHLQKGHAVVFADLDNDGDQDVFTNIGGAYLGDRYADVLFENPGFPNHWIKVRLVGTRSNRAAIGARLRLDVVEDGARRSIYRHVATGASFGSHPLRREIGIGRATRIETLEVYWPASDSTQRFHDVPSDGMVEIVEGQETYRTVPLRVVSFPP